MQLLPLSNPVMAFAIVSLAESGRITEDLALEAMDNPNLASKILQHEMLHWYVQRQKTAAARGSTAAVESGGQGDGSNQI